MQGLLIPVAESIVIPYEIMTKQDITPANKLIYSLIRHYGVCFESSKTMAALLGLSPKTILRGVNELAAGGYISKDNIQGEGWILEIIPKEERGRGRG